MSYSVLEKGFFLSCDFFFTYFPSSLRIHSSTPVSLLQTPGALHQGVSNKLVSLAQGKHPDMTGKFLNAASNALPLIGLRK